MRHGYPTQISAAETLRAPYGNASTNAVAERDLKSDMPRGDQYVNYRNAMIKLMSR